MSAAMHFCLSVLSERSDQKPELRTTILCITTNSVPYAQQLIARISTSMKLVRIAMPMQSISHCLTCASVKPTQDSTVLVTKAVAEQLLTSPLITASLIFKAAEQKITKASAFTENANRVSPHFSCYLWFQIAVGGPKSFPPLTSKPFNTWNLASVDTLIAATCENYPSTPCESDDERFLAGADDTCGVANNFVAKMAVAMCTKNTCCKTRGSCFCNASDLAFGVYTIHWQTYTKVCLQRNNLRDHMTYFYFTCMYSLQASCKYWDAECPALTEKIEWKSCAGGVETCNKYTCCACTSVGLGYKTFMFVYYFKSWIVTTTGT